MKSWRNDQQVSLCNWEYALNENKNWPAIVNAWLDDLQLLKEVPLTYIVADERLLPMESIRFFCIDPQWVAALIDGATSIGVHTVNDASRNVALTAPLKNVSLKRLRGVRDARMHKNHHGPIVSVDDVLADDKGVVSGFLLRSDLVKNWKCIEIKGFNGERQLKILRMDTISDTVLICLFDGLITSVKMFEPCDSLHFGTNGTNRKDQLNNNLRKTTLDDASERVKIDKNNSFEDGNDTQTSNGFSSYYLTDRKIYLRRIDEGHEGESLMDGANPVELTVPTDSNGRIDVTRLSEDMLTVLKKWTPVKLENDCLRSSQFALEMFLGSNKCVFTGDKVEHKKEVYDCDV